jgi:hypothetical protein
MVCKQESMDMNFDRAWKRIRAFYLWAFTLLLLLVQVVLCSLVGTRGEKKSVCDAYWRKMEISQIPFLCLLPRVRFSISAPYPMSVFIRDSCHMIHRVCHDDYGYAQCLSNCFVETLCMHMRINSWVCAHIKYHNKASIISRLLHTDIHIYN